MTTRGTTGWVKIPGATVVCSALLLLLAPGGPGAPLTPVTITALPLEPAGLPFYAKEEGFFARQGIDAKILILSNPAQVSVALLSDDAQFAGAVVSTAAILKSRNAPVRAVAAGALYRPSAPTTAVVWANKKKNDPASAAILARYVGIDRTLIANEARTRFGERLRPALAQPWIDAFAEFGLIPASFAAIDLVK